MARYFRRRKFCRFTAEGVQEIDYKDIATLKTTSPKAVRLSQAVSPVLVQNISVSGSRYQTRSLPVSAAVH